MTTRIALIIAALTMAVPVLMAKELELPPEITPAIREACEADVRRLCVRPDSTYDQVKTCVILKYAQLNPMCKQQLVAAGLFP